MHAPGLAEPRNRGVLLDLLVFALNLAVMRLLVGGFVGLVRSADGGSGAAKIGLGLYFLAILLLPAAGAVLKRWHFHRSGGGRSREDAADAWGCLLNPAFYFAVSLVISLTAAVLFAEQAFGEGVNDRAGVFLPLLLLVVLVSGIQTVTVYRYFTPPRTPPRGAFWRDRRSALLGDLCIFVNMILFQVLWNVALAGRFERVRDLEEIAGRLFLLWFVSLLVYFPPRIFYLAEDADRPTSWGTIALANSPLLLRVMGVI